jgi:hypothetical protein
MGSATLSVALSPILELLMLSLVGGVFGLVAAIVAARFGTARLLTLWIVISFAVGSIGAFRAVSFQRALGRGPEHVSAPGMFVLLIVSLGVILSMPTFAAWRRARRGIATRSYSRTAIAAIGWTFVGLLLATLIALGLDLADVPFIPFR